jgi:hypothetical protein
MVDVNVVKTDFAADPARGHGIVHSVQTAKKSRFPAAGRSDHRQDLVAVYVNTDFVNGAFIAIIDFNIPAGHAWIVDKRGADGFPAGRGGMCLLGFPDNVSAEHGREG